MFRWILGGAVAASLLAMPVNAQEPDKPITNRDPDVVDVAKTPVNDLNVGRDGEIPSILMAAVDQPYSLDGLRKCRQLSAAIEDLNQVLGPDIDLPQEQRDRISGGRMAQWVVTSFIPFRGLIREVSGANAQDRKVNAAIQAGVTRRGFLKGVGAARGCAYPASPAPAAVVQARYDELQAEKANKHKDQKKEERTADSAQTDVASKSEPDVRQTPPDDR